MLPMHRPPMKVASRNPIETAVEPMVSCKSWYHTTSYISAAHPLSVNRIRRMGRKREAAGCMRDVRVCHIAAVWEALMFVFSEFLGSFRGFACVAPTLLSGAGRSMDANVGFPSPGAVRRGWLAGLFRREVNAPYAEV